MKQVIYLTVTNDLNYDQRMIRICSTLANHGYQVKLIGRKLKLSKVLSNQVFQQKRISCFFYTGKLFYLEYNIRLFWYLMFSTFDAICAIDLDTIVPCFLITKLKRTKLIYDAHEYFTEVPEVVSRPLVKKIWTAVEKITVPRIKYAYTVCESIADLFNEKYNTSFAVIRNVPFQQVANPQQEKPNPKIVIYQGALNEGRGLEEAITAMQWIENAELWLIGEGDLSQALRLQTKEQGLEGKVIFKGYQTPDALKKITPLAYIGLNLLQNKGLSYYYSLANKAFDYIQSGIPAVNMDFPEYRKLNQAFETAILIENLEPRLIAEKINQLLVNKKDYERLKKNTEQARKIYIWEEEEKKLVKFYQKVFE